MKFSEIVQDSYSETIGSIKVLGQEVQLCDHMEEIDGAYYATTFILNVKDRQALKTAGARFGTLSDGTSAVYLNEKLLQASATLRADDVMTQNMMERMKSALQSANTKTYSKTA